MAEPREDENIVDDAKIEQFCGVTGATVEAARELLQVCCGNLEMAIGMHMDGSCDAVPACNNTAAQGTSTSAAAQASAYGDEGACIEDEIRAPIPQRREVLVEETANLGFRARRRQARSVFDGFRDFQAEARQQEERLGVGPAVPSGSKQRTLEDLFRPPIDLTYKGTFQNARDVGTKQNKWLLVNVQNVQEFPCQVLNRDIWSCPHIRKLVKEHFIFWQVYHDSAEGKKYMQFYKIKDWPYVAVVDPRTGENLAEWTKLNSSTSFKAIMQDFLAYHKSPDTGDTSPPAKRLKREPSIVDASEEDQIEAAIKASLNPTSPPQGDSSIFVDTDSEAGSDDLETFSDSDSNMDNPTPGTSQSTVSGNSKNSSKTSQGDNKSGVKLKSVVSVRTEQMSSSGDAPAPSAECEDSGVSRLQHPSTDQETSANSSVNGHQAKQSKEEEEEEEEEEEKPSGPEMMLLIRFPDGAKEQLNIPSDSTIKALLKFVTSKGIKSGDFELVTNFPRRKLHLLSPGTTLEAAGLHAKDTLFVHCV